MASPTAPKSAYTVAQIEDYESYVSLPTKYRLASKPALDVNYLTALHIHQITSIPYENLTLHYSSTHVPSLDPQHLFQKIVGDARGRGGYCMEVSIFFHHVLRALGFDVYMVGARPRVRVGGVPSGGYMGWVHIVNLVTLPNTTTRYMVDVGFGGDGPTLPLPLTPLLTYVNLGSQQIRLIHEPPTSGQFTQSQPLWQYQYKNSEEGEWNTFYGFTETEFSEVDFGVMNWYTGTYVGGTNFQTVTVLGIRFLRGVIGTQDGDGEIEGEAKVVGKLMLIDNVLKRNDGGKTIIVTTCRSERERVKVLREYFGIELTKEEVAGVRGRNVELRGE